MCGLAAGLAPFFSCLDRTILGIDGAGLLPSGKQYLKTVTCDHRHITLDYLDYTQPVYNWHNWQLRVRQSCASCRGTPAWLLFADGCSSGCAGCSTAAGPCSLCTCSACPACCCIGVGSRTAGLLASSRGCTAWLPTSSCRRASNNPTPTHTDWLSERT